MISKFFNTGSIKKLSLVFLIAISSISFGQSKKLWMLTAENAYKAKDWATAATYYAKVLDDTTVLDILFCLTKHKW
ncbi:MAG: hypothetical protein IPJ32_16770 [Sphingobacteriaceae bacterium]|nr:hypothetical protein [Sphingobacteriaceae bacterium]